MSHQLLEKMKTIKLILDYMPDVFLSKNWFKSSIKTGDSIYKEIDLMSNDTFGLDEFLEENHIKMKKSGDMYIFSKC